MFYIVHLMLNKYITMKGGGKTRWSQMTGPTIISHRKWQNGH